MLVFGAIFSLYSEDTWHEPVGITYQQKLSWAHTDHQVRDAYRVSHTVCGEGKQIIHYQREIIDNCNCLRSVWAQICQMCHKMYVF